MPVLAAGLRTERSVRHEPRPRVGAFSCATRPKQAAISLSHCESLGAGERGAETFARLRPFAFIMWVGVPPPDPPPKAHLGTLGPREASPPPGAFLCRRGFSLRSAHHRAAISRSAR